MIHPEPEPTDEVKTITAELLDRLALNADGQPFADGDPNTWQAADEAEPEVVSLGFGRFQIVNPDATDLALAAGAIDENLPPILCLHVRFYDADQPQRRAGQYVAVDTGDGLKLLFVLWLTGEDVHDPAPEGFDLGPGAVRTAALDVLQRGDGLLVQVLELGDEEGPAQ